jgi:hypothetical protein
MEPQRVVQRRVEIAFLLQPFVCAGLAFMLFPLVDLAASGGRTVDDATQNAIGFAVLTGIIAVPITGIAASAFGWLSKRTALTATRTMLCGAMFGNTLAAIAIVGTVVVRGVLALPSAIAGNVRAVLFGTLIGTISSAVFWVIGGRHAARSAVR